MDDRERAILLRRHLLALRKMLTERPAPLGDRETHALLLGAVARALKQLEERFGLREVA